jgi:predicted ATP-grasp superfamily ATP-dependent carboligase
MGAAETTSQAQTVPAQRTAPGQRGAPAGSYDILILDAASRQTLASARSLGRAGLRVALGECRADGQPSPSVLAFRSRYSACNLFLPSIADDADAFGDAVVDFVERHPTDVVVPAGDGAIAALMWRRERLMTLGCVLALPSNAALEVANDKDRTLEVARCLGIEQPRTMRVNSVQDVPAVLGEFAFPFVLKPTSSWTQRSAGRLHAAEVISEAEAVGLTRAFLDAGAGVLAQEWVGGRREGVTLFLADGDVLASFAHVEHRTVPTLGGASVVWEGVPMPADIYESSVRLVTALGLQGLCEVEFRRDAHGRPLLMEINPRLAGPIEIALRSGIDFPVMVWRWATGLPIDRVDGYRTGVRMRWLHGDLRWLRDNYQRAGRPDSMSRRRSLWTFMSEFARTYHYDCLDRRDLGPVLAELRTIAMAARRRSGRSQLPPVGLQGKGAQGVSS